MSFTINNTSALSTTKIQRGDTVTASCSATGSSGFYQYAIYYKKANSNKWLTAQDYKANTTVSLTLTDIGSYDVCIKAKDDNNTTAKKYFTVVVTDIQLDNTSKLSAATVPSGDPVNVICSATGGSGLYQYAVYYKKTSSSKWATAQDYKANTTVPLALTDVSNYDICVKVKDGNNTIAKKYLTLNVTLTRITNTSSLSTAEIQLGKTVTVYCSATGSTGFYKYAVYYKKADSGKWTTQQDYSAGNTVTIQPAE